MQVSWIDPQDVASLAESLRRTPPAPASTESAKSSFLEEDDVAALHTTFEAWEEPTELAQSEDIPPEPEAEEEPLTEDDADAPELPPEDINAPLPDISAFRLRLQAIRERAIGAGLLPVGTTSAGDAGLSPASESVVSTPTAPPAFVVPLGSVIARLEAFAAWTNRCVDPSDLFVIDDHGDLLWGAQDQAGLILSTLMALNAVQRGNALSACGPSWVTHKQLPSGKQLSVIPCSTRLGFIQVAMAGWQKIEEGQAKRIREALIATMDAQP